MNWYLDALKKYAVFNGRARRKAYWFYTLFSFIAYVVLFLIDKALGTVDPTTGPGVLSGLYALGTLLPGLGVTVRRLHDTGRSGWWILVSFIPLIGEVVLLVFLVSDSKPGTNEYGPNPKEASA